MEDRVVTQKASYPSLPLFVDDYEAATAHLTLEEDGAYNRLMRLCWRTPGCSVPDDRSWIMRRMRVDEATYDRVVEPIIDEFFTRRRGRILQKRLREEFEYVRDLSERRKQAGKKGGSSKSLKNNKTGSSKAKDLLKQNASKTQAPIPIPIPIPNNPPNPPSGGTDDLFPSQDVEAKTKPETPIEILSEIIPRETAKDFIDHRKALRKPLTVAAAKRAASQLRKFKNPVASVDASIMNGWAGVFEQDRPQGGGRSTEPGDGSGLLQRVAQKYGDWR